MALRREKVVQRLVELRERNSLTQEDAAHKVGVTVRQWQRWEAGESMPYPKNLDLIASRFGITVAAFFDEEESPTFALPTNLQSELAAIHRRLDELFDLVARVEEGQRLQDLHDAVADVEALARSEDTRRERTRRESRR